MFSAPGRTDVIILYYVCYIIIVVNPIFVIKPTTVSDKSVKYLGELKQSLFLFDIYSKEGIYLILKFSIMLIQK